MENKKPIVLKRSSDFLLIKEKGKRKTLSPWLLLGYRSNSFGVCRFGCTISRKVGSAVTRNKLKRWTKECFRKMAADGFNPEYDFNLVFRPMAEEFYKELSFEEFKIILAQLHKLFK